MIAYFDTSALIPLVIHEAGSATATRLWREAERLVSVRILYAEGRAALAMAQRTGRVPSPELRYLNAELDSVYAQVDRLDVDDRLVRRAGDLSERFSLRAYDAVHLAGAERVAGEKLVFVSGDAALCAAGGELGMSVTNVAAA